MELSEDRILKTAAMLLDVKLSRLIDLKEDLKKGYKEIDLDLDDKILFSLMDEAANQDLTVSALVTKVLLASIHYPLEKEIVVWGKDKGIVNGGGDIFKQHCKTIEEIGELISHLLKAKDIRDDIGDIFVTIVLAAANTGTSLEKLITEFTIVPMYKGSKPSIKLAAELANISTTLACLPHNTNIAIQQDYIRDQIYLLQSICFSENLSLKDCVTLAYKEIQGRTGKSVNGIFIKDN